jgi:hypothetical protein
MLATVVAHEDETTSTQPTGDTAPETTPTPPTEEELLGDWVSEERQTIQGPMRFVFRLGRDGRLEITGTPTGPEAPDVYHRSGTYRLDGDSLVSPAINQGQPAHLALRDGRLTLTIDETLRLRLHRE